ncbi:MAG: biopolymer transporter ExbB [Rhodobacteraceae bacterium]|nr:biopolymer transporter ExbB [Paracoccaceae bacterium]
MMLVALGLFLAGAYVAAPRVAAVFLANPYLNAFILGVFVIGVLSCFLQVIQLFSSVVWIEGYAAERAGHQITVAPRLLAALASLLRSRDRGAQISATSARSILDSVATRIDEAREITRYIVSLLIFLGLLGTFYGLATMVPAVVETIRSLAPEDAEGIGIFDKLMTGLESQLGGMGTAFSSSLLGLTGSLVVGLLELFASQSQNRFYREFEEWLSTITRLGLAGPEREGAGEGSGELPLYAQVIDQIAEQLALMQAGLAQGEAARGRLDTQLAQLGTTLERLAARIESDNDALATLGRIADGQERLIALFERREQPADFGDAENRMRLRSIDVQLLRILEEISAGRLESIAELRNDLAALNRSVRQLSRGAPAVTEWKG